MKKRKPIAGETLYMLNVGNNARYRKQILKPVIVSFVGRKYFSVKLAQNASSYADPVIAEFHIDSWREKSNYSAGWMIYESEQEWADEKEVGEICREIGEAFKYGCNYKDVPLDKLRQIKALLIRP